MNKIALKIEMDEETYNLTRLHIGYWLSNPRNRRTKYPYTLLSEFYEDKRIEECDDAISRQDAKISLVQFMRGEKSLCECIDDCPSVKPKREQGEWIEKDKELHKYFCSKCGCAEGLRTNFCWNCGAEMR